MRRREQFGTIATLGPPANLRYDNVEHRYFEDFNPATYRWREDYRPQQVVGKFLAGAVRLRVGPFINPIFGPQNQILENVKRVNPADLLFTEDIKPGEFNIFIDYPKLDNFNFDAQSESFIYFARMKGIPLTVIRDEYGQHTVPYFHGRDASNVEVARPPTPWRPHQARNDSRRGHSHRAEREVGFAKPRKATVGSWVRSSQRQAPSLDLPRQSRRRRRRGPSIRDVRPQTVWIAAECARSERIPSEEYRA